MEKYCVSSKHYLAIGTTASPGNRFRDGDWEGIGFHCKDCDYGFVMLIYCQNGKHRIKKFKNWRKTNKFIEQNITKGKLRDKKNGLVKEK